MSFYLPEIDACFVHVPKTAGIWVERTLRRTMEVVRLPGWRHRRAVDVANDLPDPREARFFGFVRHPVSYYESLWRWENERVRRGDVVLSDHPGWHPWREIEDCWEHLDDFPAFARACVERHPGWLGRAFASYAEGVEQFTFLRKEEIFGCLVKFLRERGWRGAVLTEPVMQNVTSWPRPFWPTGLSESILESEREVIARYYR